MGNCNCKLNDQVIINSEVKVPEQIEPNIILPKRKSTKLVKIKGGKESLTKNTDVSTECYLRQNSLLKQSQLQELRNSKKDSERIVEIQEITRSSTNHLSSEKLRMIQADDSNPCLYFKEEERLIELIKSHFLFKDFDDSLLMFIVEEILEYQIEENIPLIKKGEQGTGMFIITKGQVELTIEDKNEKEENDTDDNTNNTPQIIYEGSNNNETSKQNQHHNKRQILNAGESFGELSLVIENSFRVYSAISLTPLSFYLIDSNSFQLIRSRAGSIYTKKSQNYDTPLLKYLNSNQFLKTLAKEQKENIAALSYMHYTIKDEEIENDESIFVVIDGQCICENDKTKIICEQGAYLGLENIFSNFKGGNNIMKKIISITNCSFIVVPLIAFKEVFGLDYKYVLLYHFFKTVILADEFLKGIINVAQTKHLFDLFEMKQYKDSDAVYSKTQSELNEKIVIVFDGELVSQQNPLAPVVRIGELYGVSYMSNNTYCDQTIISKGNSLLFECQLEKIKDLTKSLNLIIGKKIKRLKTIDLLKMVPETKLIEISNNVIPFSFIKDDVVISSKFPCEHFYFLLKGEVKHMINTKVIRKYTQGSSFGELFLLNETNENKSSIIASSDRVKTYAILKEYFFKLIEDPEINDYIKRKMCLENKEIKLNELYYLTYLGRGKFGNVSLVHNEISLYAAKAISRAAIEKQKVGIKYLLNEKRTLEELNHPFILKLVKTMKNNNWCFFLLEFITGKTLNDYLSLRKTKKNIEECKFYGACLFVILDYINSKGYIHRDIKPANIMIDYSGYITMIDFGAALKIQNGFAKTMIGTPHFMAPEVINGKGYSYQCDYWSVGVCLYYIYYGEYLFGKEAKEINGIYDEIISKEILFASDAWNYELNNLIKLLLVKNPKERLANFKSISQHLFFKDYQWKQLINKQLKPPFVPTKDKRFDEYNLTNTNTTFLSVIENEKVIIDSPRKSKLERECRSSSSSLSIVKTHKNWFDEF